VPALLRHAPVLVLSAALLVLALANHSLRLRIAAQNSEIELLGLELRSLRQHLEAERILSAAQSRLAAPAPDAAAAD
jgi:hypothetical protein